MTREPSLTLVSPAGSALVLTHAALRALPPAAQVADVGLVLPGKRGRGVWLAALLERVAGAREAAFVNLGSRDPAFAVSLAASELARGALVVYELDGAPLPEAKGGPFRFLVPGHADECVNVKALARIELAAVRGRDTRPADDAEHKKLHEKKQA